MHDTATVEQVDAATAEDVRKHVRVYLMVFGALAVLTVVTVAVGYLRLPVVPALVLALVIALVKGSLVAGYFMHLISEKRIIHALVGLTLGLLVVLFFLFTGAWYDQDGGDLIP